MRCLVVMVIAATALSGCTAASEDSATEFKGTQAEVAKVVEDLQDAGRRRDENKICEQLIASELRDRIKAAGAADCQSAMDDVLGDADTFELDVKKVTVQGNTATAEVVSDGRTKDRTDTLRLVKQRGAWRIAALGG